MDGASEDESRPVKLAHRQLLVFPCAAHTTTMAAAHVMYDLCAMPSYIEPLRAEISALLKEQGEWSQRYLTRCSKWTASYANLRGSTLPLYVNIS